MATERRQFLSAATALGIVTLVPAAGRGQEGQQNEDISATEDLMREHGVLNRVLLIYEEGLRRLRGKKEVSPEVFRNSAQLIRRFVENYHERLEERFIFPEFEKQKRLVDLVTTLRQQHEAGRRLTDVILRNATGDRFGKADSRQEITRACEAFIRMYRPHEAREDTVLFPTLRQIVPARRIRELGEQFEKEEDRLFGEGGFQKNVEQVAGIEKQLSIYDLAQFTPK
jgi:hemerythrin-like domain-containing protein